jgi:allophanate hydrolase subunit 1
VIGRSPVRPFVLGRSPECLFAPGDRLSLRPVSADAWTALDAAAARGAPVAERLPA